MGRALLLQFGLVHPSVVQTARTVFEELALALVFPPTIIPWANRVDIISAEEDIVYNDGITGSHFAVGRMDWIMIPHQVSSFITEVPKLSTAALQVRSCLMWSWISVPST